MTARVSIPEEKIIQAALDLIREGGWEKVSARGIANRLGSSTMPIYSAIGSMDQLRMNASIAARRLLSDAQRVGRTGNPVLDLAVGQVVFAKDEPRLFRFIVESQHAMREQVIKASREERDKGGIGDLAAVRERLESFSAPINAEEFVMQSWIYTSGLAFLVSEGNLDLDETQIEAYLSNAGAAFYFFHKNKDGAE